LLRHRPLGQCLTVDPPAPAACGGFDHLLVFQPFEGQADGVASNLQQLGQASFSGKLLTPFSGAHPQQQDPAAFGHQIPAFRHQRFRHRTEFRTRCLRWPDECGFVRFRNMASDLQNPADAAYYLIA
jgi:hypothetical protein